MILIDRAKSGLAAARRRSPFLDHLIRTYGRYQADGGDRLAAAVTFYWFLSLFPILLLAISVLGYVYGHDAQARVSSALSGYLPSQLVDTLGSTLQHAKAKAGIIGLVGLLFAGMGWIDGLRDAIRTLWHQNISAGNIVTHKVVDVAVLLGLIATVGVSVVVTGATTAATHVVLGLLGVADTLGAKVGMQVVAYLLATVVDTGLFLYLFTRLPRVGSPLRRVLRAAVFGAVGFEILKFAGAYYVARTTSQGQATYGAFAVVVGLLLFLNLVSRLILIAAAFAVTAPYDSDIAPSGTSGQEEARKAGIPPAYAEGPAVLYEQGAPTPLLAAVQGQQPPQQVPEGRAAVHDDDPVQQRPETPGTAAVGQAPPPGGRAARQVARAGVVLTGLGTAAVAVYSLRTVRSLLRG